MERRVEAPASLGTDDSSIEGRGIRGAVHNPCRRMGDCRDCVALVGSGYTFDRFSNRGGAGIGLAGDPDTPQSAFSATCAFMGFVRVRRVAMELYVKRRGVA